MMTPLQNFSNPGAVNKSSRSALHKRVHRNSCVVLVLAKEIKPKNNFCVVVERPRKVGEGGVG